MWLFLGIIIGAILYMIFLYIRGTNEIQHNDGKDRHSTIDD